MVSETDICNRALEKIGAAPITNINDNSTSARRCRRMYSTLRDAELAAHPWSFAVKRAELAADAIDPLFGRARQFPLPSDYLRLLELDPELNTLQVDYQVEGAHLVTNWDSPLRIRYVSRVENTALMPPLFVEALASRMAVELCEGVTQSNTKKRTALEEYILALREARKANAFARVAQQPPEDEWVTVRR